MAKRQTTVAVNEHKLEDFAADLGKMLGQARSKAEGWLGQRESIIKNLTALRDEATKLLADLGHDAAVAGRRGRKAVDEAVTAIQRRTGRPVGSRNAAVVGGKKKRTMSAKARAAISAAQKARWARQKGSEKKS